MARLSPYFAYKTDGEGRGYLEVYLRGNALLRLAATNKGTAFSERERRELGLEGMLPPQVCDLPQQVARLYRGFCRQPDDIAKYQYLRAMQERSEVRFYAVLQQHLEEMMPIVYTPTVGKAVQQYSDLYQAPRGITVSTKNIDHIDQILADYPLLDVRMIVATDSSAILGIGDQGHGGLAICIGKLALYTAGAGVSPFHTMPVNFDVGTDRRELLEDPITSAFTSRACAVTPIWSWSTALSTPSSDAGRRRSSSGKTLPRMSRSRSSSDIATALRRSMTISRARVR